MSRPLSSVPALDLLAHRVGQAPRSCARRRRWRQPPLVEAQPVEQRRADVVALAGLHVARVGLEDLGGALVQGAGHGQRARRPWWRRRAWRACATRPWPARRRRRRSGWRLRPSPKRVPALLAAPSGSGGRLELGERPQVAGGAADQARQHDRDDGCPEQVESGQARPPRPRATGPTPRAKHGVGRDQRDPRLGGPEAAVADAEAARASAPRGTR